MRSHVGVLGSWRVLTTNRFEITGVRTGGEPSGAHRDRRAEARDTAGAWGGIQILGMVLPSLDESKDQGDPIAET